MNRTQRYKTALQQIALECETDSYETDWQTILAIANKALEKAPDVMFTPKGARATFDNTQAFKEGWALFNDGELQRLDEAEILPSDCAAIAFVLMRAEQGSDYHKEALLATSGTWIQEHMGVEFLNSVLKITQ